MLSEEFIQRMISEYTNRLWLREHLQQPPVRCNHRWHNNLLPQLFRTRDPLPVLDLKPTPYDYVTEHNRWIESVARNGFNHGKATSPRTQRVSIPKWMHSRPRSWTGAKRTAHRIERRTLKYLLANEEHWLEAETYRRCVNKYDLV